MGYIVHWKDGTSSAMDDKQFENMPHEMESEIGKVEQTPDGFTDTIKSTPCRLLRWSSSTKRTLISVMRC